MSYNLPIGTVLFSSNADPTQNITPGMYNHCAIIIDSNFNLVEAQEDQGVILTSFADYRARPYAWDEWVVLYPKTYELGKKAAEYAQTLVGKRYGKLASIRKTKRKLNCISVISQAYSFASGSEIQLIIPDDCVKYPNLFVNKIGDIK